MAMLGRYLYKGHKHKCPVGQARMGYLESRGLYHLLSIEQNVHVEKARSVGDGRSPPHLVFHILHKIEHRMGR